MNRLTVRHAGVATIKNKNFHEAAEKLAQYEETGMTPEQVSELQIDYVAKGMLLAEYQSTEKTGGWNPIEERLPSDDRFILLSFANFSLPMIGRYHDGAFYLGDCDDEDTCSENDLFVNAWMELPGPYRTED